MPGLQDLLKRLRKERQRKPDASDLGSTMEDIQKKLDEILQTERQGIEERVPQGAERDKKMERLDQMPPSPAGRIRALQSYDFTEPEAKRKFDELLKSLQQQMMQPFLQNMQQGLQNMSPQDLQRMREMMELMSELQQMDELERQLRSAQDQDDLQAINPEQVERLLGEESARDLERLRELARKLEEAGYLDRQGDKTELTARAIRKIADKALRDIFAHLKRDRFGRHMLNRRGAGGDPTDESKRYEFGDPFLLDLKETVMNAVERTGQGTPVRLVPDDFAVYRTEFSTQSATVVMLDLSRSMIYNGCFLPAKKVALALNALIAGQFPRDQLHIIGFSLCAREFKADQIPGLNPSETSIGTNMQAGFQLSRQLLGRQKGGNKQIIMITDGEPTAHMEDGEPEFSYPPTRRTIQETLKEVQRCTREGITINTFMLEQSRLLTAFVEQMAKINRGRAFFATPERLGEYVLVDYVANKRRAAS